MDLKSILTAKEGSGKYYWALILEPNSVAASIWGIVEEKVKISTVSPPVVWETEEEMVTSSDTVLSSCIQNFPENLKEPTEVVFGLPNHWVGGGEIKEEHLEKIKKICSELSLKPLGFVVIAESISHFIKTKEGSPTTSVTIGIFGDDVEISIFRMGKIVGTTLVARSVSIADDVAEGLTRISTGEPVPSRFILYNGKEGELKEMKQALEETSWDKFEKINFLHFPKIEIITPDDKLLAVALAGGLEIENVTQIHQDDKKSEIPEEISPDRDLQKTQEISAQDVGFVLGEDVVEINKEKELEEDVLEATNKQADEVDSREITENQSIGENEKRDRTGSKFNPSIYLNMLTKPLSFIKSKIGFMGKLKESGLKKGFVSTRRTVVVGLILFFIMIVAGGIYYWYIPKATVTVFVSPKKSEESVDVLVTQGTSGVNLNERKISGQVSEETVEGEKTISTSGVKTVGERASGEVTIYRTGVKISLPEGTSITSPGGLKYTLDEDVEVASGSASTPGTTKAKVSAAAIGAEYNLASGESFSVSNYTTSEIEAKSESSFSGGSSREINVVSSEDEEKLEGELVQELSEKGLQKVTDNLSQGKYVVKESVETEVINKSFDNKPGDEGSTLKLNMSLKVSVVVIDESNLLELAKEIFKDKVPEGFVLRDDQVKVEFEFKEKEDNEYKLRAKFVANLLPQVDPDEISKRIAGKYPDIAKEYLNSIEGFQKIEVELNPGLPGKLGTLPRLSRNIVVEVAAYKP